MSEYALPSMWSFLGPLVDHPVALHMDADDRVTTTDVLISLAFAISQMCIYAHRDHCILWSRALGASAALRETLWPGQPHEPVSLEFNCVKSLPQFGEYDGYRWESTDRFETSMAVVRGLFLETPREQELQDELRQLDALCPGASTMEMPVVMSVEPVGPHSLTRFVDVLLELDTTRRRLRQASINTRAASR